ncbi:patatin-like phospholipase family protein [Aureimonas sp. N4]|uniref:patatin-like phospholipase family protein n=1 Tax=Aureimonas sp. N4 TaxID=1638165 RepID=UPI000783C6D3|nr:patatin-like phospholipase family protein [Aureimonas sp. N4]
MNQHTIPSAVPAEPRLGLALGGGGARGIAHIHVLRALDELGLRPSHIAGTSIGALMGAAYAAGLTGLEIEDHVLQSLAHRRLVMGKLWRTRPANISEFLADGGFRFGQLNAEKVVAVFLPDAVPKSFAELRIPLTVMATSFFAGCERPLREGDLASAVGASVALPAVFRPVRRDEEVLIDGGISNPMPFDIVSQDTDFVVASDVTGGPVNTGTLLPSPMEAMFGASQLMMHAIIRAKLACVSPDVLIQPEVSIYKVLDFMRARVIIEETAMVREDAKRRIGEALEARLRLAG